MSEQWKGVPGWPGYEVSDAGRVRSLTRSITYSAGYSVMHRGRVLKSRINASGYPTVSLQGDGRKRTEAVHRIVASVFLGPRPPGLVVCHENGNPVDNRATNLRYDTVAENNRDRLRHGTNPQRRKTRCPQGHPYDEANTYWYRGHRQCLTCRRSRTRPNKNQTEETAA